MSHNCKQDELNRLNHRAQTALKWARIDLAAFLALDEDAKAARWRGLDQLAKFDLVCQQMTAKYGSWEQDEVEAFIVKYDQRWGTETLATEAAVEAALERLAAADAQSAVNARQAGRKEEASYFQRSANSYAKALEAWRDGVRPQRLQSGQWLLPSRSDGVAHILTLDGDWRCTCKAHDQAHWAKMLIIGLEVASDDMERFADPVEVEPAPLLTAAQLGQKLAAQRARIYGKGVVGAAMAA